MANALLMDFLFLLLTCFLNVDAEGNAPRCPPMNGIAYIQHDYPCYFFTCYNGQLTSTNAHKCPSDAQYYKLLMDSGVQNPCTSCAKYYLNPNKPTMMPTAIPNAATTQPPTATFVTSTQTMMTSPTDVPTAPRTDLTTIALTVKEIHLINTNSHILYGEWASGITTLRQCLRVCEETNNCLGFDFSSYDQTCWLHNRTTICRAIEAKAGCIHFGLFAQCPPNQNGSNTTPDTNMKYTKAFKGHHLANGTVIPLAMEMANAETCVAICRLDDECVGADFDTSTNSCWIHDLDTECGELMPKPACTHYRVKDGVCVTTTPMPVATRPSPVATTLMSVATTPMAITTTPMSVTTVKTGGNGGNNGGNNGGGADPDSVTTGFVESVDGFHLPGGVPIFRDVTLRQCLDSCLGTPYCLALDYDELDGICYFHFQETYCGEPEELYGVKHFKKLPCNADLPNDVSASWAGFHVEQGQLLCTGCTLSHCMESCSEDMQCAGLDYDIRDLGCYLFTAQTVCGPLIPKDYCIHVSRDTCVPKQFAGFPIPDLIRIIYPPPAVLPSGWQAFPGIRVRNAVQVGQSGISGDECVDLCDLDPSCMSGDYNMADGSCWLHLGSKRQCGQPEASDIVFHFKRNKCVKVYGVLEPYISPLWMSP